MTCCGKAKSVLKQGRDIATGFVNLSVGKKYEFTDDRIRACQQCDEQTWMSAKECTNWLAKNGIKILTNFTELEKLPKLPKQEQDEKRRRLYCRLCKCYLPAKARVADMKCPLGKWSK